MKIALRNQIIGVCLLVLASALTGSATELKGTVKSVSGAPLAGVDIYSSTKGFRSEHASTDEKGQFTLPDFGPVIFFRHRMFRPLTKLVDAGQTSLDVTLEDSSSSELKLVSCSNVSDLQKRIGFQWRYLVPNGLKLRESQDIDYEILVIYKPGDKNSSLRLWFGGNVSDGLVPDDLILNSREYTERLVTNDGVVGIDVAGTKRNGEKWRQLDLFFGMVAYDTASPELAKQFDSVIDGACVDTHFWDKK